MDMDDEFDISSGENDAQLMGWLLRFAGVCLASIVALLVAPGVLGWFWEFMQYVIPHKIR
jgi:hypothetical protein